MELTNIHPAEAYLRNEQNPSFCISGFTGSVGNCLSTGVVKMPSVSLPRESASVATSLQTGTTSKNLRPLTG